MSENVNALSPIAVFDATLWKVQTMAAGGFRVTIDGTSQDISQAAYLMPFADAPGVQVRVTFERVPRESKQENEQGVGFDLLSIEWSSLHNERI